VSRSLTRQRRVEASYVLAELELYDWGAFGGLHRAEIDLAGTAIIGPTGAGKTTLVDALMTLLVASPRYNLASTGGHESDRDLVSYVRGVSGAGNDSGDNAHVARTGAVLSGLSARFVNGENEVRIGALLWLDGSSSATADLKRRWVFCNGDGPCLEHWLSTLRDGGTRALKALEGESPGLKFYESKQVYLSRLRGFFEVGENAFTLLNRAAGLKQLNSIDEVFRELVLDDSAKFERAQEVADEFNTLDGIHAELQTARRQRDALLPIERDWGLRLQAQDQADALAELRQLLPRWYAAQAADLYAKQAEALGRELGARRHEVAQVQAVLHAAEAEAQGLQSIYLQAGGQALEHLQARCLSQQALLSGCRQRAHEYQQLAAARGWNAELVATTFADNRDRAQALSAELADAEAAHEQQLFECDRNRHGLQTELQELQRDLEAVRAQPDSNLPPAYLRLRAELAEELGLPLEALLYLAELVEVQAEHALWRGAIERAIGGHRLRLLVPPEQTGAALRWINTRDNRLHVRLLDAQASTEPARFLADGYTRRLNYRAHPLREAAKQFLAGIDLHCVDSSEALREREHALTVQGMVSGRRGLFDKQDQRRLDQDWMTGFDNRDRLGQLTRAIVEVEAGVRAAEAALAAARRTLLDARAERSLIEAIAALEFSAIDVPAAQREVDSLQAEIDRLLAPESDAATAKARWQAALQSARAHGERLNQCERGALEIEVRMGSAQAAEARARARAGAALTPSECERLQATQAGLSANSLDAWQDREREASAELEQQASRLVQRLRHLDNQLVRAMTAARHVDTGALAEVGSELVDVPAYLQRLRQLIEEALPEKQQRFLGYLNQSSDQGVTQLLSDVENEVARIEERIEELNLTLQRVDFQPGRFLRLEPRRVVHQSLKDLDQALRVLRSAALRDDEGESHYRALQHLVGLLRDAVDKRKTLGARALLDPRHRLQFAVSVIERSSGQMIETRTSSQGGSGGEKEIIASYVLTASLSYALCPAGASRPLFATIVLDEAFSKSSQAVAGRIIGALSEFGLHPLFVTPNKELRLLREHTRSAILVHRRGSQASLSSLSWQALEEFARRRSEASLEVAD
jgi:uncharacterized protein YPO0396